MDRTVAVVSAAGLVDSFGPWVVLVLAASAFSGVVVLAEVACGDEQCAVGGTAGGGGACLVAPVFEVTLVVTFAEPYLGGGLEAEGFGAVGRGIGRVVLIGVLVAGDCAAEMPFQRFHLENNAEGVIGSILAVEEHGFGVPTVEFDGFVNGPALVVGFASEGSCFANEFGIVARLAVAGETDEEEPVETFWFTFVFLCEGHSVVPCVGLEIVADQVATGMVLVASTDAVNGSLDDALNFGVVEQFLPVVCAHAIRGSHP